MLQITFKSDSGDKDIKKKMAPSRFRHRGAGGANGGSGARERREVTPFSADERRVAETADILLPVSTAEEVPAEWRRVEAPPNFTWVCQDELAGMGWPKSRDQVRFLVEQGIDRLVTLSSDKIPPHYAFPDLKWSLIPVEDFHGPAIRDIKKFLNIMDCARKEGEVLIIYTFKIFKINIHYR